MPTYNDFLSILSKADKKHVTHPIRRNSSARHALINENLKLSDRFLEQNKPSLFRFEPDTTTYGESRVVDNTECKVS